MIPFVCLMAFLMSVSGMKIILPLRHAHAAGCLYVFYTKLSRAACLPYQVLNGQKLLSLTEKYCLIQQDRRFCRDKSGHCVTVRRMETGIFPSLIPM